MTNPNDSAHPQHGWSSDPKVREAMKNQGGMTKRELFAAMAMQGLCRMAEENNQPAIAAVTAILATRFADALIAQLNKEPEK